MLLPLARGCSRGLSRNQMAVSVVVVVVAHTNREWGIVHVAQANKRALEVKTYGFLKILSQRTRIFQFSRITQLKPANVCSHQGINASLTRRSSDKVFD